MNHLAHQVLHALVESAAATVDPQSSDVLYAAHVRGYVVRHCGRLDEVVGRVVVPGDLRLLRVVAVPGLGGGRRVTLDFSATPFAGLLE